MSNQVRISSSNGKENNEMTLLESAMRQMYLMQLSIVKSNLPSREKVYEGIVNTLRKSEGHFDLMMVSDFLPPKYKDELNTQMLAAFKSTIEKMTPDELLRFIKTIDERFEYNKPSKEFASKEVTTVLSSILM